MIQKQISKHYYMPMNKKKNKNGWYRLRIDGIPSDYEINMNGEVRNIYTKDLIKPQQKENYYPMYNLRITDKDGNRVSIRAQKHRLLAACFIPIPRKYLNEGHNQMTLVPNHIDGDKSNSVISNLEWTTTRGNAIHARETGLLTYMGEKSHLARISNDDAIKICELMQSGMRPREVSEEYGYPLKVCYQIYSNGAWKWLTKNYDFSKAKNRRDCISGEVLRQKNIDIMNEICENNEEISDLLNDHDYDNTTIDETINMISKRKVAKFVITTSTDKKSKKWKRIVVDGIETHLELSIDGIVRDKDDHDIIYPPEKHHGTYTQVLRVPEVREKPIEIELGRLIASIFLPVPREWLAQQFYPENLILKYKDNDRTNYCIDNLEWELIARQKNGRSDLTEADADRICKLLMSGIAPIQIADKTGYSVNTIRNIRSGKAWTHVSCNYDIASIYKKVNYLSEDNVRKICELLQEKKYTRKEISEICNVNRSSISDIKSGRKFSKISCEYNI